ncbi:hypothetical protein ACFL3T_03495 [Patescibacteria group bacterium]
MKIFAASELSEVDLERIKTEQPDDQVDEEKDQDEEGPESVQEHVKGEIGCRSI